MMQQRDFIKPLLFFVPNDIIFGNKSAQKGTKRKGKMKTQCQYLNQRNHSFGKLTGVQCKSESEVKEKVNASPVFGPRSYEWCKVHSYTADRFIGARNQSGYITQ